MGKNDSILTTSDIATVDRETEEKERERNENERSKEPVSTTVQGPAQQGEPLTPLFPQDRIQDLRKRWRDLQVGFVDEPRRTVKEADELVAQVMQDLARGFADERDRLEHQWNQGDQASTEDLRLALRRYRSFFERFLSL